MCRGKDSNIGKFFCRLNPQVPAQFAKNATEMVAFFANVVGAKGFEPSTPCSQSKYSTRLSYAPMRHKLYIIFYLTQALFILVLLTNAKLLQ